MKICIISNYFGKPPKAFQLWLDSCGSNSGIEWLFLTDIDMSVYRVPKNMKICMTTFESLKKRLQSKFEYEIKYDKPWLFCAFKPVLGIVFEKELTGVDYWGWCDCDVIFGDLDPVIRLAEAGYDKVMPCGHFSIIRNSPELNDFIYHHRETYEALAVSGKGYRLYDERHFRFTVMHEYGAKQASEVVPFINLHPRWGHFTFIVSFAVCKLLGIGGFESVPCVFIWRHGHITGFFAMPNHLVREIDIAYIHFFKRNIRDHVGELKADGTAYLIEPSGVRVYRRKSSPSYWWIRWINRPRVHWSYVVKRLNFKTLRAHYDTWRRRRSCPKNGNVCSDGVVYYPDC